MGNLYDNYIVPAELDEIISFSPITGQSLAKVSKSNPQQTAKKIDKAHKAFLKWQLIPAPRRGELVRQFGNLLREHKGIIANLITQEVGKISSESLGEVQEMIDVCDFAVGLSRQLCGSTIASERPGHRMMEQWHPLGVVGIISAFNFPVAVWAWNAALALVCGDSVVWKPSEKAPLSALYVHDLLKEVIKKFGPDAPPQVSQIVFGNADIGESIASNKKVALVSATGSTKMGREVGQIVAKRFGKSLLELGGNNAVIVTPTANLKLAIQGIIFGAYGTCGQRCTTTRRVIVHEDLHDELVEKINKARLSLMIGDPTSPKVLVGPLIDKDAFDQMQCSLDAARISGGKVFGGRRLLEKEFPEAYYVDPALVVMPKQETVVKNETFAPILYVMKYKQLDQAIAMQNDSFHGLSSSIFTNDIREAELFMSTSGSDCGIANVNIGTSGAEIGGAFGGEKETGGGRESGSDAWKNYMRRTTNTINYSEKLPLAQGVKFE